MSGSAFDCHAPVVDAHVHCSAGCVALLLRALDLAQVNGAVILAFPGEGARVLEEAHRLGTGRLRVLVAPDLRRAGTAGWGAELASLDRLLESEDAAGIKLYKDASFGVRTLDGSLVSLLSPELEPIWAIAAARDKPVVVHCGDPADFWRRLPRMRARQLEVRPERRYRGSPDVPGRAWMIRCRDELYRRHPEVRFVGAHLGGFPATATELARFMCLGPADTSAALEEVLTFDRPAVERILRRHERDILWGSDLILGTPMPGRDGVLVKLSAKFLVDSLRLATADEPVHAPAANECPWSAHGLALTGMVRESILGRNAVRTYW